MGTETPDAIGMAEPTPRERALRAEGPDEARAVLDSLKWQQLRPIGAEERVGTLDPDTGKFWKREALTNALIAKWFPVSREPVRAPAEPASEPDDGVPTYLRPPDTSVTAVGDLVASLPELDETLPDTEDAEYTEPTEEAPAPAPVPAPAKPRSRPAPKAYDDDDEESWHTEGDTEYVFVWPKGLAGRLILRTGQQEVRDTNGRILSPHIQEICAGFGLHENFPPGIYRTYVRRRAEKIMASAPFKSGQIVEKGALDRVCLAAQVADGRIAEARLTGKPIPDRERLIAALGGRQDRAVRSDAGAALQAAGDPPLIRGAITTAHKGVSAGVIPNAPDRPAMLIGEGSYDPYAAEAHGGALRPEETTWVGPPLT